MKNYNKDVKFMKIKKIMFNISLILFNYFLCIFRGGLAYYTNDDGSIQDTLSGLLTGEPYPVHQFINVVLSYPLSLAYKLCGEIQWWYIYSHILIIIGMFLIHKVIIDMIYRKKNSELIIAFFLLEVIDILFINDVIQKVSFTMVPVILGTGIILNVLTSDAHFFSKKYLLILTIGLVICFIHREECGMVLFCYLLVAAIYMTQNELLRTRIKYISLIMFLPIIICMGLGIINSNIQKNINGVAFDEFNKARVEYGDYPHDSFEENPDLYSKVEWDYNTYIMLNGWCFLDEKVSAESLSYISKNSNLINKNREIIVDTIPTSIYLFVFFTVFICFYLGIREKCKGELFVASIDFIGTLLLIAILIYRGRVLYRAVYAIIFPATMILLVLAIWLWNKKYNCVRKKMSTILFLLISIFLILVKILSFTDDSATEKSIQTVREINDYILDNKNNFYIKEVLLCGNIDPFSIYPNEKPSNSIICGGAIYYSDLYNEILKNNYIDHIDSDLFKEKNVYLISSVDIMKETYCPGNDLPYLVYCWLRRNNNVIGIVQTDIIGDEQAFVYKYLWSEDDFDDYVKNSIITFDFPDENVNLKMGDMSHIKHINSRNNRILGVYDDLWSDKSICIMNYSKDENLVAVFGQSFLNLIGKSNEQIVDVYVHNECIDSIVIDGEDGGLIDLNTILADDNDSVNNIVFKIRNTGIPNEYEKESGDLRNLGVKFSLMPKDDCLIIEGIYDDNWSEDSILIKNYQYGGDLKIDIGQSCVNTLDGQSDNYIYIYIDKELKKEMKIDGKNGIIINVDDYGVSDELFHNIEIKIAYVDSPSNHGGEDVRNLGVLCKIEY